MIHLTGPCHTEIRTGYPCGAISDRQVARLVLVTRAGMLLKSAALSLQFIYLLSGSADAVARWGLVNTDASPYGRVSLRATQRLNDPLNNPGVDQDFFLRLVDAGGQVAQIRVSEFGRLSYPPNPYREACVYDPVTKATFCSSTYSSIPRELLLTVNVPLSAFTQRNPALNLAALNSLELVMSSQARATGSVIVSDIEFTR
jgi:hypothetical protein